MNNQGTATTTLNSYLSTSSGSGIYYLNGEANIVNGWVTTDLSVKTQEDGKIHPELYFKFVKSKLGTLEMMRLKSRLKKLEKAFYRAVDNGQEALGKKLLTELTQQTRESVLYAKGVRHFVEREDIKKFKNRIRGGHISDTLLKDFTRVIPDDVLAKKKKFDGVFDDFVIYHYWDEKAAAKAEKKEKMTPDEKQKMRDPILFGIIKETDRLYYVADWADEFCDLSFDELIDVIGKDKDDSEFELTSQPKITE